MPAFVTTGRWSPMLTRCGLALALGALLAGPVLFLDMTAGQEWAQGAQGKAKKGKPKPEPEQKPEEKADAFTTSAASFDDVPLIKFDGTRALPAFLESSASVVSDGTGLKENSSIRTVANNLHERDFVADVEFLFAAGERSIFVVGLGSGNETVSSRVHGPGFGGYATFGIAGQGESGLANFKTPGPHLFRIEKHGAALTMAVGSNERGTFKPYQHKTIADLKATAPFLARPASSVFVRASGGSILAMRLIVDGKAADAGKAPKPAEPVPGFDKAPLRKLGGQQPLPAFLQDAGNVVAERDGVKNNTLRTVEAGLNEKDFLADIQFRFAPNEQTILHIGLGGTRHGGFGWEEAVYSRVHGPGFGGYATLSLQGEGEKGLGKFVTAGPHLFRIEKHGDVLTMSIGSIEEESYKPYFRKSILNLKSAAPYMTRQSSTVFVQSTGAWIEAMRFLVNGKPAETRVATVEPKQPTKPAVVAKKETVPTPKPDPKANKESGLPSVPGATGRENLIALTKGSLPTYLLPQRDVAFDAKGGLVLDKRNFHSDRTDFNTRDFTFDVLFRFRPGEQAIAVIGIGPGQRDHNGAVINNCVCSRLHGPGFGGYGTVTISGQAERDLGKYTTAGPHLFRLQKRGNVLTMAVTADFNGKFVPDAEKSITDLKAAAPFLNDKNSWLFLGNGGIVDAVRLVVEGEPIESRDVALSLPSRIVEGKPLTLALKDPGGRRFSLASGPKGLSVTPTGQLTWTPTAEQVGRHQVRIGLGGGKETIAVVEDIEVVSAEDAKLVGRDLAKLDSLYKMPLLTDKVQVVPGLDGASLLVLDGKRVLRVVGDGVTVKDRYELPAACERIAERADYFAALSEEKKALLFIDKTTLAIKRTIRMDYFRRNDLAVHPSRPLTYVSVTKSIGGGDLSDLFMVVDEKTGDVHEPEGLAGTWLIVAPDGKELYVGRKQFFGNSSFDELSVYAIREGIRPNLIHVKNDPGANGRGIVLSPDGKRLSYLSYTGYPLHSKNIPAWDPTNLDKRPVSYPCKDHGASCFWVAYHPKLELAAAPIEGGGAICFQRETGEALPDRVELKSPPLGEVITRKVYFAPDGQHLLLECEGQGERFLRRAKLRLTASELSRLVK